MTTTVSVSDEKLIQYTEVYNDYYELMYHTVYQKTNNYDETEDICQELFTRLLENIAHVREMRKWIFVTLRNIIYEYYRKKGKNDDNIDELYNDVRITFVNGFKDTRILIDEAIQNVIDASDDMEFLIFELIGKHKYTYKDVASKLKLSFAQVRYKYNQTTIKIADYLKKRGIENLEDLL